MKASSTKSLFTKAAVFMMAFLAIVAVSMFARQAAASTLGASAISGGSPLTVTAENSKNVGDFSVAGDGEYSYESGILTVKSGVVAVSLAEGISSSAQRIVVAGDAELVLDGVAISATSGPAVAIQPGVNAAVTLAAGSDNSLKGGNGYAGLWVGYDNSGSTTSLAHVTISGAGSLSAEGGSNAAGIGGNYQGGSANGTLHGNIVIASGTVKAQGGSNGAGIGSGRNNQGSGASYKVGSDGWGSITIAGGSVTAQGGANAAGIGGGNHVDSGQVVIDGGTVNATGGGCGAGIGSGIGSSKAGSSGNDKGAGYYYGEVTINGGVVTAQGGGNAAGIGGGMYADGVVVINGGTVAATGGAGSNNFHHGGAGIGGGYEGHGGVTITDGDVTATGATAAAGIGSGGSPNSASARGANGRADSNAGITRLTSTSVSISGGTIEARAGDKGGAGIGGGTGADKVSVSVSGGSVRAFGSTSSESALDGGAGIGGGYNAAGVSSEAKYMVDSDVSVSIAGGSVLAVGGWGASGIGSGAANKPASEIAIDANKGDIQAYSDGTKFAIDTRELNADGTTSSITEGRTIIGDVLQATFVHAGVIGGEQQDTEGLHSIKVTNDLTRNTITLTDMPAGYRSFSTNVSGEGAYTVSAGDTETDSLYFNECIDDVWAEDESVGNHVKYKVTSNELSDNFYLYPVKLVAVEKRVSLAEGLDAGEINQTLYFALQKKGAEALVTRDDGSVWVETIELISGVPQSRAYFLNLDNGVYDVWEVTAEGAKLEAGTEYGTYKLAGVSTEHATATDNNAQISDDIWTDELTVRNSYEPVVSDADGSGNSDDANSGSSDNGDSGDSGDSGDGQGDATARDDDSVIPSASGNTASSASSTTSSGSTSNSASPKTGDAFQSALLAITLTAVVAAAIAYVARRRAGQAHEEVL